MNILNNINIIVFILISIIGTFLIYGNSESFQSPYISYDNYLDSGLHRVNYEFEIGDKGPKGEPGKDAEDRNVGFYFKSLFVNPEQ
jgi:hypothetical protein